MARISQFIIELRRRNVFRSGAAYVVVAWLLVQVSDILLETLVARAVPDGRPRPREAVNPVETNRDLFPRDEFRHPD